MANAMIIFRREFRAYFDSIIAYVFLVVFLLLPAIFYMSGFFLSGVADMRGYFGLLPWANLVFLPALTMRLWAEDRRTGTLELLMTLPMRPREIVLGKYFAALAFYAIALAGTLTIPIMLMLVGNPDVGAMFAGYLGSLLLGAFFIAVGIFVSGLFKDQIAAFLVATLICAVYAVIGLPLVVATIDGWIAGLGSFFERFVGIGAHFAEIQRGVVDVRTLIYFVSMTVLFLVLNTFSLEGRKY